MKRFFSLFFCLLLIAVLAAPALADVIWEPMDDFYFEHYDECRLTEQDYALESNTVLYRSPEDPKSNGILAAGTTQKILCVWTAPNGDEWGYIEYYADGWVTGWIDMSRPGAAPRAPLQTLPVVLTVGALAAVTILILFIRPKKR